MTYCQSDPPREVEDFRPGIYRHWKGPLYLAIGLAHDADADEELGSHDVRVVYVGLQLDGAHGGPRLAVRDHSHFFERVHTGPEDAGFICVGQGCDGVSETVRRFEYVGQSL